MKEESITHIQKIKDALYQLADALDKDDVHYAKISGRTFVVNLAGGTIVTLGVGGAFRLSLLGFSLAAMVPPIAFAGMVFVAGFGAVVAYSRSAEKASKISHVIEAQSILDEYSKYLSKQKPLESSDITAVGMLGPMVDASSLVLIPKDGNEMRGSGAMAFLLRSETYTSVTITFNIGEYVKDSQTRCNSSSELTNAIRKKANELKQIMGVWVISTLVDEK
ncbi:uncharacterized protein LOC124111801 isoform X2 [Haliotis rufescens]|nr:uncharacterized protein LOC124111801 isoform X2 [Haliotis rufescens]